MTRYSDLEITRLIEQLRDAGFHPEHPAWGEFFHHVRPLTIHFAIRADLRHSLNLADDDLDDISQIVAEKLFSVLSHFNPQYHFSAWLAVIVKHCAIEIFRRNRRKCPLNEDIYADPGSDPAENSADFLEQMQNLRGQLNPQQQQVLDSLLCHYDKPGRVRLIAHDLGLGEARIYQILNAICEIGHSLSD
jgi:RNA polymerase sigma factor (sigma-70 family)